MVGDDVDGGGGDGDGGGGGGRGDGVTTSADDCEDSGESRFSTPHRKPPPSSPDFPKASSPHPTIPPPQPEPPPEAIDATSAVPKSAMTATAETLRPCALVAPQG